MGGVKVSLPSFLFLMVGIIILISSSCNQAASQSQNAAAAPIKCCFDNHMPNCTTKAENPIKNGDANCNAICLNHGCSKGGFCKFLKNGQPKKLHYCHCYCQGVLFMFNLFVILLRRHSKTCRVCLYHLFLITMSMSLYGFLPILLEPKLIKSPIFISI